MHRVLEKIARQLNGYDEASLMHLWHLFASQVKSFEPSKRWEEAALSLCLIQAVHWKNQLFNYNLALSRNPDQEDLPPLPDFFTFHEKKSSARTRSAREEEPERKATVLAFPDKARQSGDGNESADVNKDRKDDD
ncbi:hypothetical protein LJC15_02960 [Desulfovibrio sp. OttesenSCG-928-G11]|nr:hypothetical protein [Desulfovibrio sp. OttesenSCG-928-G11]